MCDGRIEGEEVVGGKSEKKRRQNINRKYMHHKMGRHDFGACVCVCITEDEIFQFPPGAGA
jgi:hypothetical protein